jgi:Arc/MetJ family transcription regulator
MRTTIAIDHAILARAEQYTGLTERSALVRRALTELVQREAGGRLALMGGSDPDAWAPSDGDKPPV